ncbi:hypothetical protein pkur_cds_402 [Pandoravirus kuranda]|uniref:Uncharacterized protein n=1 Tax=Pandoravirus kuranda TaxID=3019033 RepID=A0AA95J3L2_9VIRU|nr:hypothetical protein pkur_cds_402 [Pandoravirus kuranda]
MLPSPCAGCTPAYEEALPTEVQCAIMVHLADSDPKSALRMASTSRQQANVLHSLRSRLAAANTLLVAVDNVVPTAADYLRAHVALGARDPHGSVLLWLLEAFVRFLFSEPCARLCSHVHDDRSGAHTIDCVADDPSLGDVRRRVRAWYQWLAMPLRGRAVDGAGQTPIDLLFARCARCPRRRDACLDSDLWYLRREAIRLGHAWYGHVPGHFVNQGVRQCLVSRHGLLVRAGRLRPADFTEVFRPRFCMVPSDSGPMLVIAIDTPEMDALLGVRWKSSPAHQKSTKKK